MAGWLTEHTPGENQGKEKGTNWSGEEKVEERDTPASSYPSILREEAQLAGTKEREEKVVEKQHISLWGYHLYFTKGTDWKLQHEAF